MALAGQVVERTVVSKYHEPEEHMNIYEVHLTNESNPARYFIPGLILSRHVDFMNL